MFAPLSVKSHTDCAFPAKEVKEVVIIQAYVGNKLENRCFSWNLDIFLPLDIKYV